MESLHVRRHAVHRGHARRHFLSHRLAPVVHAEDLAMNLGFAAHLVIAGAHHVRAAPGPPDQLDRGGRRRPRLRAERHRGLARESGTRRQALCLGARRRSLFLGLLRAIRDGRTSGYGLRGDRDGLCLLSPHYQLTYYLLVAGGFWTLYLVFLDPRTPAGPRVAAHARRWRRRRGARRRDLRHPGAALPRATSRIAAGDGGTEQGWEYATGYALPIEELMTTVLPQFNGVLHLLGRRTSSSSTPSISGRSWCCSPRSASATGCAAGFAGRSCFIAGFFLLVAFGGAHAVLPAVVRGHADDEEASAPPAWRSISWRS